MEGVPPKFAPFKKTRVVLALEDTAMPIDQKTDLTAHPTKPFRAAEGGGAETVEQADAALAIEPLMFGKKRTRALKEDAEVKGVKIAESDEALPEFLKRAKAAYERKKKRERASGLGVAKSAAPGAAEGVGAKGTLFSRTNAATRE